MTKQEKIKEAYGLNVEKYGVTSNGYSSEDNSEFYPNVEWHPTINNLWRPIELHGIEDNNGWIKIESEIDLPIDDKGGTLFESGKLFIGGNFEQRLKRSSASSLKYYFIQGLITHYKTIEKSQPPIY